MSQQPSTLKPSPSLRLLHLLFFLLLLLTGFSSSTVSKKDPVPDETLTTQPATTPANCSAAKCNNSDVGDNAADLQPTWATDPGTVTSTGTITSTSPEPVRNVNRTTNKTTSTATNRTTTTFAATNTTSTATNTTTPTSTAATPTTTSAATTTSTTTITAATTTTTSAATTTSTTTTAAAATTTTTTSTAAHPNTTVKATTTLTRASTTVITTTSPKTTPAPPPPNAPSTGAPPIQTTLPRGPATITVTRTTTPADLNEPVSSGTRVAVVDVAGAALTRQLVDTASLVAALLFGLLFFLVTVALFVTQAYESYRRKDYTQVDYLINGMYSDSGV